jgi:methylenetetrahydrofolate reductase (NADPH)
MSSPASAAEAAAASVAELLVASSLEMSPDRAGDAAAIAALVPAGTRVYVNHLPRHGLAQSLAALRALRSAGLDPVPHIAARRIGSRPELEGFLKEAASDAAFSKILLIGGDDATPLGPYPDGAAVLREGILARHGVREIALPGYPEGHPRIPRATLEAAFSEKLALANGQGLGVYVVTQFSFAPSRVIEYCSELARRAPGLPVYVGLAGPTEAATLLRFAQRCGVSASLRALRAQGMGAIRLVTHTGPSEQLAAVARYCAAHAACNVVGAHLFSFGGALKTAAWMNDTITSLGAA